MNQFSDMFQKLRDFKFDFEAATLTFAKRLQREHYGWDAEYTERVLLEYRKFFYLMCITDYPLTPSEDVDQAWHQHLIYTQNYREFCEEFNGRFINHGPTKGGKEQREKFTNLYSRTLDRYREVFNEEPPSDIWPAAEDRFSNVGLSCWVDLSKAHVISTRQLNFVKYLGIILIVLGILKLVF